MYCKENKKAALEHCSSIFAWRGSLEVTRRSSDSAFCPGKYLSHVQPRPKTLQFPCSSSTLSLTSIGFQTEGLQKPLSYYGPGLDQRKKKIEEAQCDERHSGKSLDAMNSHQNCKNFFDTKSLRRPAVVRPRK